MGEHKIRWMTFNDLLSSDQNFWLDIACGSHKHEFDNAYTVGMDIQKRDGVDLVWDLINMPWPLPDNRFSGAIASHIIEHIPKVAIVNGKTKHIFMDFMDEVWRVLKVGGQFHIGYPHGKSNGFLQDPTHCSSYNENVWLYFDPDPPADIRPDWDAYDFYRPKPWKIISRLFNPAGNCDIVLEKRKAG